ncbi:MAG: alpha/beta hydrolase [Oleiphilaceae bacterium]|nr:alpha/beta hydrolase [Oleiphilaceae bacterium]
MNWLLLRGLARESRHWGDFADRLQQSRPGDRVHLLDLPGTGIRNHQTSPASVRNMACFLDTAAASLPRPLALIGMSLGGMVALDWAQRRAHDCEALVLIGTSSRPSPPWRRFRPRNWPAIGRILMSSDIPGRERQILNLTSNQPVVEGIAAQWIGIAQDRAVTRTNELRQVYAASRFRVQGALPQVPALVLASRADRLVDWHCSQALARAGAWPLRLHPSAGHDLALDDPQWLIDQINNRFAKH